MTSREGLTVLKLLRTQTCEMELDKGLIDSAIHRQDFEG